MPRWAQSIRFRLALAYSLAVFAAGAILIVTLLVWQTRRLDEPIIVRGQPLVIRDQVTGEEFETPFGFVDPGEFQMAFYEAFERQAYRNSLDELRRASLVGLAVLAVVAFGSGWLLAGWTLRPMGRIVGVARDISGTELSRRIALRGPDDELKELADTFDAMLDRLEASFDDQRRFVQDASHELRNPLAVTRTNLELVLDDPDASVDELRRAVGVAHGSSERLGHIVDELIHQARQGVPATAQADVDLVALVHDVAAELEASAARRDLTLLVSVGSGIDDGTLVVKGSEAAIRRAVTNLVVNAVRLAPEETTVELVVKAERDLAVVSVIDEGPGIPTEHHDAVFERFWRGSETGGGLGLGLSIVRQVARRHGGDVSLVSAVGEGSTFSLTLPRPMPS